MKFSDITEQDWASLQPYLDTCLLPITGLSGREQPWEAVIALEELRDVLDTVEIPFKGRVVTYPAMHYASDSAAEFHALINQACIQIKEAGFKYVIIATANPNVDFSGCEHAELVIHPQTIQDEQMSFSENVAKQVQKLWQK